MKLSKLFAAVVAAFAALAPPPPPASHLTLRLTGGPVLSLRRLSII